MKHAVLLSDDRRWIEAVRRRLHNVHCMPLEKVHVLEWSPTRSGEAAWLAQTHTGLVDAIESIVTAAGEGPTGLRGTLGVIDLGDLPPSFDVTSPAIPGPVNLTTRSDWLAVAAMLVLTFPEVYWVLRTPYRASHLAPADAAKRLLDAVHLCDPRDGFDDAMHLAAAGFEPLFDPAGLRDALRRALRDGPAPIDRPLRAVAAAAIDEEEAYTLFNAYAAYRIGYRANVVTSYAMARALFGDDVRQRGEHGTIPALGADAGIQLAFEDLFLNFPDRPTTVALSAMADRARALPRLQGVRQRVTVTVGSRKPRRWWWDRSNPNVSARLKARADADRDYWKQQRENGVQHSEVNKPLAGLYDLWTRSGIKEWNSPSGYARGFDPAAGTAYRQDDDEGGHSTPGRLYGIATRLLFRCRLLARENASVADALHGATLALEAQELLGGRTPTISLEAIALKHEMEVLAESMFYGLEHHLDVKSRYEELEAEVDRVSSWYSRKTQKLSKLNALIHIMSALVLRFRDYNRYDEEQEGLVRLRLLHRRLSVVSRPALGRLAWFPRLYFDTILRSLPAFIFALVLFTIALTAIFSVWSSPLLAPDTTVFMRVYLGFAEAVSTFFGADPPGDLQARGLLLPLAGTVGVVAAFVHLGIFMSHLYGIVARK